MRKRRGVVEGEERVGLGVGEESGVIGEAGSAMVPEVVRWVAENGRGGSGGRAIGVRSDRKEYGLVLRLERAGEGLSLGIGDEEIDPP